jgi:hypothetical protein
MATNKPSIVFPDLARFVARRMGATTIELDSSHVPMLSHPSEVLDVFHSASDAIQRREQPAMHV